MAKVVGLGWQILGSSSLVFVPPGALLEYVLLVPAINFCLSAVSWTFSSVSFSPFWIDWKLPASVAEQAYYPTSWAAVG